MTDQAIEPAYKKRVGYQGTLLGGFATLAATMLVMGHLSTHETIDQRVAEDLQQSLSQVIPDSIHDNSLLDNKIVIKHEDQTIVAYQGVKDQHATAVAYSVIGYGYAGEIKIIMGINADGEILGVRVLSHAETPGLGDKIEEAKSDWIYSFDGLSLTKLSENQWKVKKDGGVFDQFSGATITPRGVVAAVKQGLDIFNQHRGQFLAVEKPVSTDQPMQPQTMNEKTQQKTEADSNTPPPPAEDNNHES